MQFELIPKIIMEFIELLHSIYLYIGDAAVICLSISVILCLLRFKHLELPFKRLFYFLVWNLIIEILARIGAHYIPNNLPLLHLYTLGEFILLSWFYQSIFKNNKSPQSKFWYFIAGISILIILNSIFLESIYDFNPIAKTTVQIILIGYAIFYFYNITNHQFLPPKTEKGLNLVNSAIIVYYSGSLFIFMCNQLFFDNSELYKAFWAFNAALNLVFQILILWGIWKAVYSKTHLSS